MHTCLHRRRDPWKTRTHSCAQTSMEPRVPTLVWTRARPCAWTCRCAHPPPAVLAPDYAHAQVPHRNLRRCLWTQPRPIPTSSLNARVHATTPPSHDPTLMEGSTGGSVEGSTERSMERPVECCSRAPRGSLVLVVNDRQIHDDVGQPHTTLWPAPAKRYMPAGPFFAVYRRRRRRGYGRAGTQNDHLPSAVLLSTGTPIPAQWTRRRRRRDAYNSYVENGAVPCAHVP